jgi:hypothetical protein
MEFTFPRMTRTVKTLLIVYASVFVLSLFIEELSRAFALYLQKEPVLNIQLIYRVFTYSLVGSWNNVIGFGLFVLFMWWVGCGLEREWGTRTFIVFLACTVSVSGILSMMFLNLVGLPFAIMGTTGLTFAIITVLAFNHPESPFYMFGIFPLKAKWLLLVSFFLTLAAPSISYVIYAVVIQIASGLVAVIFSLVRFPVPPWLSGLGLFRDRSAWRSGGRFDGRKDPRSTGEKARISRFPLTGVWDKDKKKIKKLIDEIHADARKQEKDD